LPDVQELEGISFAAIRDGVRRYLVVYENLARDSEPDQKAGRRRRPLGIHTLCRQRAAEEVTQRDDAPVGEHWKIVLWKIVLGSIDGANGPPIES
jgi:hypothetical protein